MSAALAFYLFICSYLKNKIKSNKLRTRIDQPQLVKLAEKKNIRLI